MDAVRPIYTTAEYFDRCFRYAKKMGESQFAREFAAYAAMRYEKIRPTLPKMRFVFKDFYRLKLGRSQNEIKLALQNAEKFDAGQHGKVVFPTIDGEIDFKILLNRLDRDQVTRAMLALYYGKWGFNQFEIAEIFGLSSIRVCQILRKGREKLMESLEHDDSRI